MKLGRPLKMYSTPFRYKSLENPTALVDIAEESSAKAEATNFNPTTSVFLRNSAIEVGWKLRGGSHGTVP